MHPDTVIDTVRGLLAVWGIGCDDKRLVSGAAKMLECSDHRVAHAVDVREKGFRDNRYSHTITVAALPVDMVTDWRTRHEL